MKILYLSPATSPDYLCDCLLHGLRSLPGVEVTDYPRLWYMYSDTIGDASQLYGRGFTLYGLLGDDHHIDRSHILKRIEAHEFDLILYGSVHRSQALHDAVWRNYCARDILYIDGEDHSSILGGLLTQGIYFKRELSHAMPNVHPIQFAVPAEKIFPGPRQKSRVLAHIDPRDRSTYIYSREEDYYADYRSSLFAITTKKCGWDCLRHYEIMSQGCIPLFLDLAACPPTTMVNLPKAELLEALTLPYSDAAYWDSDEGHSRWLSLYRRMKLKFNRHSTTLALAQYVLDTQRKVAAL